MRFPNKLPTKYVIPLFLASVIGTAAAVTTLFTHTFPAIPITPPPNALVANCSTLFPNLVSVTGTTSGFVFFDCGPQQGFVGNASAFVTVNTKGASVSLIPTFTLPPSYMHLYIAVTPLDANCASPSGPIEIMSSQVATSISGVLQGGENYDYCAAYVAPASGSLEMFTVTWTQS